MFIVYITVLIFDLLNIAQTQDRSNAGEYCMNEFFRPQCVNSDVILVKSAIYGRMRIGRCLTTEEVETHRRRVGDDPSYYGCSVDVMEILDQRCSGHMDCDVRVIDIQDKSIRPCAPGLMVYLEASYDCITAVDERRSCVIKASMNPTHIIHSSQNQRQCGSESQPWIVESPVGQRIKVTLIDFNSKGDGSKQLCSVYGTIVDKAANRNASICGGRGQRQRKLYTSTGNTLEIYLLTSFENEEIQGNGRKFMLNLEAVGCSDIIPSEETWLRRKDDVIVIGCYSTQQTWQLNCNEGKWIGVLGNCSTNSDHEIPIGNGAIEAGMMYKISDQEQVLAIVAISGCTFAVCLVIVCVGIVCLRRFYVRYKNQHDYKTLSLRRNPEVNQHLIQAIPSQFTSTEYTETDERSFNSNLLPTYSVFVGDNGFKDEQDNTNSHIGSIIQ